MVTVLYALFFCSVSHGATGSSWLTNFNEYGRVEFQASKLTHAENCHQRTWDRVVGTSPIPELVVDPDIQFQEIDGYGAAITDSAASVLMDLTAGSRKKVIENLFGKDQLGIRIVRLELGSSDYSRHILSCDDVPKGVASDVDLKYFSLAHCMERTLPLVRDVRRVNSEVKVILSPWSAPAWMKTTHSMVGGKLLPKFYSAYSNYLVRTLKELKAQGIGVQYLTVANEPLLPPSETQLVMNMSWQEQDDLIKNHLGPALDAARAEVGAVELLAFDHNAKDFEFPLNILKDAGARKYVGGTAFHCYNGSAKLLESLKAAYPEKDLLLTECSMGLWLNGFMTTIEYISRDLIIKNFEAGSKSLLLWNLALDVHGGPTNQPQSNVRGVITVEKDLARDQIPKHQLLRYLDLEGKGQVAKEPEYYLFSHLSKILKPGARRIASTYIQPTLFLHEYLGRENSPDLESVAFENPDHSVGIFLLNGSMTGTLNFHVRTHDQCERLSMPPKSVMTLLLKP